MSRNFKTGVIVTGDSKGGVKAIKLTENELGKLNQQQAKGAKQARNYAKSMAESNKSLDGVTAVAGRLAGLLPAISAGMVSLGIAQASSDAEGLKASLVTATGSMDAASRAWGALNRFAQDNNMLVADTTHAYIRMRNLGIKPTESRLKSFANTSAAMNKTMNDMIEAVADAATGEFERLKEFGIKASSQGDQVSMTFQGVTTTIGKNAEEITNYLEGIGNVQFASALENRMKSLPGMYTKFTSVVADLYRTIGDKGATQIMIDGLGMAIDLVKSLRDAISTGWALDVLRIEFSHWLAVLDEGTGSIREFISNISGGGVMAALGAIWDSFAQLPVNLRSIFTIIIGETDQAWTSITAGAELMGVGASRAWSDMAHAAGMAWQMIKLGAATAVDWVIERYADMIESVAGLGELLDFVPGLEGMQSKIQGAADTLRGYASASAVVRGEISQISAAHHQRGEELDKEAAAIEANKATAIAASQSAIDSALQERDAAIKQQAAKKAEAAQRHHARLAAQKEGETLDQVTNSLKNNTTATADNSKEIEKAAKAMEKHAKVFGDEIARLVDEGYQLTHNKREWYEYALAKKGLTDVERDAALTLWDTNHALEVQQDEAKKAADALQDAQRDIGNSLTDALMRGFEDGAGLAANFVDTLKNLFKSMVLRPIIQPIATGLAGGVTSMLMPSGASAGGLLASPLSSSASSSSGGGFNMISLASNLFGLAGGSFGAVSSGVTGLIGAGQFADAFSLAGAGLSGSAGIGGALGAVAPFLPIALPLIAGLFKKKPSDKAQWGNVDLSSGEIFGVDGQSGDKFSQENADARDTLLSGFSQFSASLGAVLGEQLEGGIRVIIGNRDGLRLGFDGAARVGEISADEVTNYGRDTEALQQAGYDYIWERFLSAADQFSGSMITLMRGITDPNDRLASAGAFGAIRTVIDADPVADYAAAVEMANRTLWQAGQDQFNTIMDLAAAYDGSVSATQELAAATQARYQTELALLAQIDAAISNTDALFASSRQQFELAGLSAEETYNYWKSLADAGAAELATLIDPAAINQQLDEINRQYLSAWGTLGADQQALMKTEYLAYIDDLETLRDERLGAAREQLDDQTAVVARETNQAISAAAERFVEAARRIEEAAAAINQAAATPVPVAVSVDMSNINDLFADVGA